MLPRSARLTRSADFGHTVRRGRRAGNRVVVVHVLVEDATTTPPRVGLVVGRSVGGAVVRNQVKRRLRECSRSVLASLPSGASVVIRALPAASEASYDDLALALDKALSRASVPVAGVVEA